MRLIKALALFALICGASGCGSGGKGSFVPSPLLGTWIVRSIQTPGTPALTCPATLPVGEYKEYCGPSDGDVYHDDGTYTNLPSGARGIYRLAGNALTITIRGLNIQPITIDLQGNTLKKTIHYEEDVVIYTLQKQ